MIFFDTGRTTLIELLLRRISFIGTNAILLFYLSSRQLLPGSYMVSAAI
jgi:hypothetical protein